MRKTGILFLVVIFIGLSVSSCNIFDWLYPDTEEVDVSESVSLGDSSLKSGNFKQAMEYYKKAYTADPDNSKARWGYAKAYILENNVDFLYFVSKILGTSESTNITSAVSDYAPKLENMATEIINVLSPVESDSTWDGAISRYNFEVNFNLMLAYMLKGFLYLGDSNNNGKYFENVPNGDLLVVENGQFNYNQYVVDIEETMNAVSSTFETISSSSNPDISKTDFTNTFLAAHDLIENMLLIYSIAENTLGNFNKAMGALARAQRGLSQENEMLQDLSKEIEDRVNEFQRYFEGAYTDTTNLNYDHRELVGVNCSNYNPSDPKWYVNFVRSPFTSHTPDPGSLWGDLETNYTYPWPDPSTNATAFSNNVAYIERVGHYFETLLDHVENANLLKNLIGTEGF